MKAHVLNPGMARLKEAICDGRIYQTRHLLDSGVHVDFVDEEGLTPLMRAAKLPDEKSRTRQNLLKLLLQFGADVNTVDRKGRHVLSQACMDEKEDIVRLLCHVAKQDVDLNLRDFEGNNPLMHSVRTGNVSLVKFVLDELKEFQVDVQAIDVRNNEDRTPYLEAKRLGYEECANILLTEGNASTDIQVNPFLDFISEKDECSFEGKVRGVEDSKRAILKSTKTPPFNSLKLQKKKKSNPLKNNSSFSSEQLASLKPGKILKRSTISPRKLSGSHLINEEEREEKEKVLKSEDKPRRRRKFAWDELVDAREKTLTSRTDPSGKEFQFITMTEPLEPANMKTAPVFVSSSQAKISSSDDNKVQPGVSKQDLPWSRTSDLSASRDELIYSERRERLERERASSSTTLRLCGDLHRESEPNMTSRRQFRSCFVASRTEQNEKDDVYSWSSHFSVHNSPSVAFLTKIMNLYAEQLSPDSSFRSGVKPINPDEPKIPTISVVTSLGDESFHDSGRFTPSRPGMSSRSSSSTNGSALSISRKFQSAVARTVNSYLPNRRALSTL